MIWLELFYLFVWVVVLGRFWNFVRYERAVWRGDHEEARRHYERGFF